MAEVRDLMTPNPRALEMSASLREAAQVMRDEDIGNVVVLDGGSPCGIVTDRDIVIRAVADMEDVSQATLGDVCNKQLLTVSPDDDTDEAVRLMSEQAVRRVVVLDDGELVGMLSIGDLAIELDSDSALADISAAPADD